MMIEILIYQEADGGQPFTVWLEEIDRAAYDKVIGAVQRMGGGNFGDVKGVGGGVQERRIDWGPGYRIYFGRDGERIVVLLGGGTKKRQQRDIENARSRWTDYKRRKGN